MEKQETIPGYILYKEEELKSNADFAKEKE